MNDASAIKAQILFSEVVRKYVPLKYERGEYWGCCPFHNEKTPSFAVSDTKGKYFCQGCGAGGDVFSFIQRIENTDFVGAKKLLNGQEWKQQFGNQTSGSPTTPNKDRNKNREKALEIWRETSSAPNTLAEIYLRSRGIAIPIPPTIRFHSKLYHSHTKTCFPAIVAGVSDHGHKIMAIHRIYLKPDGRSKADAKPAKMSLGPIKGGAVRLSPPKEPLVLVEGIEDGLSILQERPDFAVWATLGTQNLTSQKIPGSIKRLIIGADNDTAGEKAAKDAASYYAAKGLAVRIANPLVRFKDFNQQLMNKGTQNE